MKMFPSQERPLGLICLPHLEAALIVHFSGTQLMFCRPLFVACLETVLKAWARRKTFWK